MKTSSAGKAALLAGHCASLVDLVALPVWVGALVAQYGFDPQQAGGLATLFLAGAVTASVLCASIFHRLPARATATTGFAAAALMFLALAYTTGFQSMALLHTLAGVAVGCAASATHGTIGRSANPHRLFAMAGLALGLFAVAFLGIVPILINRFGGNALFIAFTSVMACVALIALFLFPQPELPAPAASVRGRSLDPRVWFIVAGISIMSFNQAMMFSFTQRVGIERGFGAEAVQGVLIAIGLVNLTPAPLAAFLETRLSARTALLGGPVVQALLILTVTQTSGFAAYALAAATFVFPVIFTHTFAFGALARIDQSGRAAAATAATMMVGAASGPIVAGTLVKSFGYGSLGLAAVLVGFGSVMCFSRVHASRKAASAPQME